MYLQHAPSMYWFTERWAQLNTYTHTSAEVHTYTQSWFGKNVSILASHCVARLWLLIEIKISKQTQCYALSVYLQRWWCISTYTLHYTLRIRFQKGHSQNTDTYTHKRQLKNYAIHSCSSSKKLLNTYNPSCITPLTWPHWNDITLTKCTSLQKHNPLHCCSNEKPNLCK